MNRKIVGVTVGTPMNPHRIAEYSLPAGGKAGQILRKRSDDEGDVEWADFEIPEQYGLVTFDQDKTITIT